jgi:predicted amino acid racemase
MTAPRIQIDLEKISHNATRLRELGSSKGIGIMGVTKVVCGDPAIADVLVKSGITTLADSRIENIERMRRAGIRAEYVLLRTPAPSQARSVVKYADISLNSEISVIERLSALAVDNGTKHKIILMVELGDLREGLMPSDLMETAVLANSLEGILLGGIGTNLACFGGIKPDEGKVDHLSSLAREVEDRFKMRLQYVSGGNSANYDWLMSTQDVGKINNLRLGEAIYLGRETIQRKPISGLFTDAFELVAEVIESKVKPSQPYGDACQDAFGKIPEFADQGPMTRAILGIGLQDVLVSGLVPCMDIAILGASSDHIIVDSHGLDVQVGDEVKFNLNYGALLASMTSPYVMKSYVNPV